MEPYGTLSDVEAPKLPKAKGYSGRGEKVGKGKFFPLKAKGKGAIGKSYRKGHNSAHN
jgi:hypothetical protein